MAEHRDAHDRSPEDERARRSLVHPTDAVLAVILVLVSVALWYETTKFEEVSPLLAQNVGPAVFPRLLLAVIIGLAMVLPFEHRFLEGGAERLDRARKRRIEPLTYLTAALLGVVVLLIPYLGAVLTMVAVCVLLPLLWGERRFGLIAVFAIVFPALVTIVFNQVLRVYFEPGLLPMLVN